MIKTNSLHAWWLAARPKTLTGASAPIILALAAAYEVHGMLDIPAALLCLFFALLMQIAANLVNDYFDCVHGVDNEERLGPERACLQGWITLPAMRIGIVVTTLLACLVGLPLIAWGGMECIIVGLSCVAFCFLYTTLFSHIAMGDVLVILFFGLIPVSYTYLFQSPNSSILDVPYGIWFLAIAQGLMTDCLLLVNNLRDRETDAAVGKKTLVTFIGVKATLILYNAIGIISVLLAYFGTWTIADIHLHIPESHHQLSIPNLLPFLFIFIHLWVSAQLYKIRSGKALNRVLGMTAMSIFLFAIIVSIGILL